MKSLVQLLLILSLGSCAGKFSSEEWKEADSGLRAVLYSRHQQFLDTFLVGSTKAQAIELLGKPEYDAPLAEGRYYMGYDILDHDTSGFGNRSYYWLDISYDSATDIIYRVETRDD